MNSLLYFSLFLSFVLSCYSLTFTIPPRQKECVKYYLEKQKSCTLFFQSVDGPGHEADLEVLTPSGRTVLKRKQVSETRFSFLGSETGMHDFCLSNEMSSISTKKVYLDVQIDNQYIEEELAKKEHFSPLENSIIELEETLTTILAEQRYLKVREHIHRNTTESTNSRVLWWSFLKTFFLLAIVISQIVYLRHIIEKKSIF
ncbi:hypothetical protein M0812_25293 [Anaeramoeba flamelloides]|uniref:GOLD domain-containing protein n=1 Tax=Anaeramoeba flamelloides TaxID=1746091 RepID=A0AAV7YGL9_9EUKA|nr:hypothetical protein M0812_25293 [Anaeramoeba flamelloides]